MSIAILAALAAGALCLGMLSAFVPLGRGDEERELGEVIGVEDEILDLGGPVIDLEVSR